MKKNDDVHSSKSERRWVFKGWLLGLVTAFLIFIAKACDTQREKLNDENENPLLDDRVLAKALAAASHDVLPFDPDTEFAFFEQVQFT